MNSNFQLPRSLLIGAVAVALVSATGCHWVRSTFRGTPNYMKSQESRPLEVPPDLTAPDTSNAMAIPSTSNLGSGRVVGEGGFTVAGTAADNWPKIGAILAGTEGVVVNGNAQAMGSYDVSYQGQTFLVRIEDANGQSRVVAISANGQILRAGPGAALLEIIKSKL